MNVAFLTASTLLVCLPGAFSSFSVLNIYFIWRLNTAWLHSLYSKLVISIRYSENGYSFCFSRTIAAQSCTICIRRFQQLELNRWLAWWKCKYSATYLCVKSSRIRSYSGPHFPAFGLNIRIQSECGKMRTRINPNTDTFHATYIVFICALLGELGTRKS